MLTGGGASPYASGGPSPSNGIVTYDTPVAGTTDRFSFTVADNRGGTNTDGVVDITLVGPVPSPGGIVMQQLAGGGVEIIGAPVASRPDGYIVFTNQPPAMTNTYYRLRMVLASP